METQNQIGHRAPRTILNKFFKLFMPVAIMVLIGAITMYWYDTNTELTKIRLAEQTAIKIGSNTIERIVQTLTNDLSFLVAQKAVSEVVSSGEELYREHLKQDWSAFSRTKGVYDQIRWMNASGQEEIRINYNQGDPSVTHNDNLQNKGGRYYFTDTIKLNNGEFFISPLDLNIEDGKVEQPVKPMIRIGTPIFSQSSQKQGILLLNYFGEQLLNEYKRVIGESGARAWLLNRNSYWMKGPSSEMEWGFMYKHDEDSMAHLYPDTWNKIASSTEGQFEDEHGLWTFSTVYPLIEGLKTSTGASEAFAPSRSDLEVHDYYWKSVLLLPAKQYSAATTQIGIKLAFVTLIILSGFAYGSWRLARSWVAEEKSEEALRRINLNLEHTVDERTKELRNALDAIITLEGTIPICSYCLKIRDVEGAWGRMESYISEHSKAKFSHGICPDCLRKEKEKLDNM